MNLENFESILRDIPIPPRPDALTRLFAEMSKDEPELGNIAKIVQADPAITAGVLQVANSPMLGLNRKVASISQALNMLGLKNVVNIATGIAIRQSLKGSGDGNAFQSFWDTAEQTALVCSYLATRVRGIAPDVAFTFGLFHDCGIPLLLKRFPNYKETLKRARSQPELIITEVEETDTGTSHPVLGYFLAKSWGLPDDLNQAILLHHDLLAFNDRNTAEQVRNLIGLVHLAEHAQSCLLGNGSDANWDMFETSILAHFGLTDEDLANLTDDIGEATHLIEYN